MLTPRQEAVARLREMIRRSLVAALDEARRVESASLRLWGFRGQNIRTRVGRVHVWQAETGAVSGPTWIFVHGFGSPGADWHFVLRRMRPFCRRIIVLDLPGHGRSPVPEGVGASTS